MTTTTPLLLSSLSLLRIYRQSYHGLLTLFAQMTIAAAILQTTLLSYCGKRLDVAYIFWISWRKKEKTLKDRSLYLSACTLGLTQWNLSCFEFKFDDTRLSSWYKKKDSPDWKKKFCYLMLICLCPVCFLNLEKLNSDIIKFELKTT